MIIKQFLTALGGGIVGAVMVLAVQGGDINLIKPAYSDAQLPPSQLKCYLNKIEDVHVEMSYVLLWKYCEGK